MGTPPQPPTGGYVERARLGRQVKRLRLHAGWSQEVLAERAGVGVATIVALESGARRRPYPSTMVAVARALGLDPAEQSALLELATGGLVQRDVPDQLPAHALDSPPPQVATTPAYVRLPVPPTALIAREHEVAAAVALLDPTRSRVRLLTLIGPGGVGKTRLGLAVATTLVDAYPDGVVFVDLARARDQRLVAATVAHALGVAESSGRSARDLVIEHLHQRQVLLLLDNFEHVLGAAPLLAEMLEACSRLGLLVTSRTALRLRAEQRFRVAPLPAPTEESPSVEVTAASPAVRLFVDRARAADLDFVLGAHNARTVAAICRHLDGLPLAIELAAARVRLLGPEGLLRRLDRRLSLPASAVPDLPERQQTLRQTLTWSHDLLGQMEQKLFRRLAVFAGGWTVEAAESVCSGAGLTTADVLEGLGVLVDNSLVQHTLAADTEPRFGMLEAVREYAEERLTDTGETNAVRARQLAYFLGLAEAAEPELYRTHQAGWLERLECEHPNMRSVLGWSVRVGEATDGLRLATALRFFWWVRGYAREGNAWFESLLPLVGPAQASAAIRARALHGAALFANGVGESARAKTYLQHSVALFCQGRNLLEAARSINSLAGTTFDEGDVLGAEALWQDSLALAHEVGDLGEVARSLGNLGEAAYYLGKLDESAARHTESLAAARRAGRTDVEACQLGNLANVARRQGDLGRAVSLQRQALAMEVTLGDRRQIAICLEHLALVHAAGGHALPAARLLGAAMALRQIIGAPQPPPERLDTQNAVATARAGVDESEWAAALAAGRELTVDQAIAEALADSA